MPRGCPSAEERHREREQVQLLSTCLMSRRHRRLRVLCIMVLASFGVFPKSNSHEDSYSEGFRMAFGE